MNVFHKSIDIHIEKWDTDFAQNFLSMDDSISSIPPLSTQNWRGKRIEPLNV